MPKPYDIPSQSVLLDTKQRKSNSSLRQLLHLQLQICDCSVLSHAQSVPLCAVQYPCSSTPLAASAPGPAPSPCSSLSLENLLHVQISESKRDKWVLPKHWGPAWGGWKEASLAGPMLPCAAASFPSWTSCLHLEGLSGGWTLVKDNRGKDIC